MKLPARLLGLLVSSAAVAGCFGEVNEPAPNPARGAEQTEQAQTQAPDEPDEANDSTPPEPKATPAPAEDAGLPANAPPDDPCPPCGMG